MPSAYTLRGRASELTDDGEVSATASIAGCWCGAGACGEDMGSYQTVCAAAAGGVAVAVASGTAASSAGFIGTAGSWSVATKKGRQLFWWTRENNNRRNWNGQRGKSDGW